MPVTYYSKNDRNRSVEAVLYHRDGHNPDHVRDFLEDYARRHLYPNPSVHTTFRVGTLIFRKPNGSVLSIRPGHFLYEDEKKGDLGVLSDDIFHELFTDTRPPEKKQGPMPPIMSAPESFVHRAATRFIPITAIQYQGSYNEAALRSMLHPYGTTSITNPTSGCVGFHPFDECIETSAEVDKYYRYIFPGDWVTITPRPGKTPLFQIYSDGVFHAEFVKRSPATPTEKETPVPETSPSAYDANLNAVYDVLAVLRVSPGEPDFEFAAKELMDMLADAFNEGFNFAAQVAETNPYADRDR